MAFAAMMMAGLDGVENKIDPGQPLDKDIYDLGPEELGKVPSMPGSLEDALDALSRDNAFLLKGDVFTEELLSTYIDYKRTKEVDAVRLRPHPYRVCSVLRHIDISFSFREAHAKAIRHKILDRKCGGFPEKQQKVM